MVVMPHEIKLLTTTEKMKKILAVAASGFLFFAPLISLAAVSFTRTPAGTDVSNPVSVNVSLDAFSDIDGILDAGSVSSTEINYWSVQTQYTDGFSSQPGVSSDCVASTTLSNNFVLPTIPTGQKVQLWFIEGSASAVDCNSYNNAELFTTAVEGDPNPATYIFSIVASSINSMITIPSTTASLVVANVSSLLSDPGFLTVAVLVIGIPLGFYVAKKVIGLFPKK